MISVPAVFLKEAESGKAFRVILLDWDGQEVSRNWLPHSQVTDSEDGRVTANYSEKVELKIPLWLLEKENISDNYVDREEDGLDELDFRAE